MYRIPSLLYWWKKGSEFISSVYKMQNMARIGIELRRGYTACVRARRRFSSKTFSRMSGKDVMLSAPCGSSRIFNAFFPFLSGLTAFSARIKWDSFAIDACQTILTLERQARIRDNFTWYILMRSHTAGYFNHRSPGHGVIARTPKELIKTARLSAH